LKLHSDLEKLGPLQCQIKVCKPVMGFTSLPETKIGVKPIIFFGYMTYKLSNRRVV